uniref:Uncharacterized protein n=1 Tax=Arundo donax TaxID=35708 RepID=A0A0A8YUU3_ARUDO
MTHSDIFRHNPRGTLNWHNNIAPSPCY